MTYRITNSGNSYYVTNDIDPISGPYDTEAKAKRRIRDLKAKEITKGVHGNLVVPAAEQPYDDSWVKEAYDVQDAQRGVYQRNGYRPFHRRTFG